MHELQQILLKKLPRLGELTFGCEFIKFLHTPSPHTVKGVIVSQSNRFPGTDGVYECYYENALVFGSVCPKKDGDMKILGHPFTHADLLEALGEDWAIQSGGQLWKYEKTDTGGGWTFVSPTWEEYPCLPDNISDLSLPEYEETRKQLIQLLTK